jgi:predicted nucleotidyltransferase
LKSLLKKHLKNNIADIFIIGSSLKDKLAPRDLDIIVLFKEKNLKQIEEELYNIKESISFIKEVHIEPLFINSMFEEKIFLTILHEGFSIKENKFLSELMNLKSMEIFSFSLENLSKIDKVRFAQTLYGRKKDGLLYNEKGVSLGQGSFMVNVEKEEIFKELMKKWKINYKCKRAFVSD